MFKERCKIGKVVPVRRHFIPSIVSTLPTLPVALGVATQQKDMKMDYQQRNPLTDAEKEFYVNLDFGSADFLVKMQFSYSVTVLEACLSEMLKSLVLTSGFYIRNALANIPELQKSTVSLLEAYDYQDKSEIEKAVITYLSKVLYHNIPKVITLYSSILGIEKPTHINIEDIAKNHCSAP
ncbi:uncharacterized protein TNCV_4379481 [Trichonephila clavipes]|nr:uncharacterized protein TNCV_4379481 [Trichonephila clavipes]